MLFCCWSVHLYANLAFFLLSLLRRERMQGSVWSVPLLVGLCTELSLKAAAVSKAVGFNSVKSLEPCFPK